MLLLTLLTGCSDATAPTAEMRQLPSEEEFSANMKANGIYYNNGGVCAVPSTGKVADVHLCFMQLWQAFAIGGHSAGLCGAAILATRTTGAATVAGSICSMGLFATYDGLDRWVQSTQVPMWMNQKGEELSIMMRQAIYERMIKDGKWNENAGCC
jgi:hypothetical protein